MEHEPAVITLTGDNALTIGLIGATLYLGALLLAQMWMKWGMKTTASKSSSSQ